MARTGQDDHGSQGDGEGQGIQAVKVATGFPIVVRFPMWLESPEEEQAIRDLRASTTPDRVVAILGGTFVETRLTRCLRNSFVQDELVLVDLFYSSGPLGPFATKIRMAYVLGMVTTQSYKDLINITRVRNAFAHKIETQSFARPDIFAWCHNIRIVETHVHPRSGDKPDIHNHEISMFVDDKEGMLSDPRERFTNAVVLLTKYFSFPFKLGDPATI
jgi:Mannitol repressor